MIDGAHKIGSDLAAALDKKVEDFRNKKLFDFGYADPNKLDIHSGSKTYSLMRGGQDWWDNGKKMDEPSMQSLSRTSATCPPINSWIRTLVLRRSRQP